MYDSKQVYQKLLPKLEELEILRGEVLARKSKAQMICAILGAIVALISLVVMSSAGFAGIVIAFIGVIIIVSVYGAMVGKHKRGFEYEFKDKVVGEIARTLEPSMQYSQAHGIGEAHFREVGHYSNRIDRYSTEDYFAGKLGDTSLSFAEIHAEYKTTSTDSKGRRKTTWHTLFKGVMFSADFHKHFDTWVTIRPDKESGWFGWIGTKMQQLNNSHIRMEDPVFEENFQVNAGDDQQARYLLTPDMQQRLLDVKEHYGSGVIISFQRGSAYLTIPIKGNWFEGSLNESVLSESQIHRISSQIGHFLHLVETLNLNTRIWTKE